MEKSRGREKALGAEPPVPRVRTEDAWEEELREKLLQEEPTSSPNRRPAAVALILRSDDGLEALFIHRVEREGDPWSGHISLPGGYHSPEDASFAETALREAWEEVAIDVEATCQFLGLLPILRPANRPQVEVFPYVFALRDPVEPQAGDEAEAWFWAPLAPLRMSRTTRKVKTSVGELLVPAYLYEDRVIWGLTYRILTTFFDLGPPLA